MSPLDTEKFALDMQRAVHSDKLSLLYQQSSLALVGNTVTALLMVTALWSAQESRILIIWLSCLAVTVIIRLYLMLRYLRHKPQQQDILKWETPYLAILTISALIWGIGAVFVMPKDSMLHEVVVFYFLIGMAGGAVAFYSVHRLMTLLTIASLLIPSTIWFILNGDRLSIVMAIAAIFFLISSLRAVRILSTSIHQSFELTHELEISRSAAEKLARQDTLTKLCNRRAFQESVESLVNQHHRKNDVFSLLLIDLDYFKKINDNHGHTVGDTALIHIAKIMKSRSRDDDICSRIGGEEFTVLAPGTPARDAVILAEDLRHAIETSPLVFNGQEYSITASIGIAEFEDNIDKLLNQADKALYAAKTAGRNCVKTYQPSEDTATT